MTPRLLKTCSVREREHQVSRAGLSAGWRLEGVPGYSMMRVCDHQDGWLTPERCWRIVCCGPREREALGALGCRSWPRLTDAAHALQAWHELRHGTPAPGALDELLHA